MVTSRTVLHLDTQVCDALGLITGTTVKTPTMSHDNQLQHTRIIIIVYFLYSAPSK